MHVQTERDIIVHQNVLLKNTADNKSPANNNSLAKKRRVTSSMLYLEEEPVFSDSEEERDYMLRVFNKYTSTPRPPRNCETGTQCDIISIENSLFALIKTCSIINPDVPTRFPVVNEYLNELVHVCRKIQSEMSHENDKHNEKSDVDNIFVNQHDIKDKSSELNIIVDATSPDFLPSSSGNFPQNENLVSRNDPTNKLTPSEPQVDEEFVPNNIEKKLKKTRKKRRTNKDESLMRTSLRKKFKPKKKYKTDCVVFNREPLRKKTIHEKLRKKSKTKPKEDISLDRPKQKRTKKSSDELDGYLTGCNSREPENLDLSEDVSKYLNDSTVHFKIPLPKKLIKPLARNWMKPSKSFILEETKKPNPHFASLRQEKVRNLYSPSRWLESDEFLNSLSKEKETS